MRVTMRRLRAGLAAGALAAVALAGAIGSGAAAQDVEALRASLRLEPIPTPPVRAAPGMNVGTPGAWGASWGTVFAGVGYQGRIRYREGVSDGAVVGGVGLGNGQETIGAELAFTSYSTWRTGLLERGAMSVKIHRALPNQMGIALGFENALTWGEGLDGGNSLFLALGKSITRGTARDLFSQITLTAGVGNGRFRFEEDVLDETGSINVFGAVGVRVAEPVSVIVDWSGQDLGVGVSLSPFAGFPLVISPSVVDITGSAGDGARFTIGAGLGVQVPGLR